MSSANTPQPAAIKPYKQVRKLGNSLAAVASPQQHTTNVDPSSSGTVQSPSATAQKWIINRRLGSGRYGNVYLVEVKDRSILNKHHLGEPYNAALKEIETRCSLTRRRAVLEADLLRKAALSPNIVKYLGRDSSSDRKHCVLMELMNLGSLDEVMSSTIRKRLAEDIATRIVFAKSVGVQVLLGLLVLHKKLNSIHRDVKLKNILVNTDGRVKLCDFDSMFDGSENGSRVADTLAGTECTMAPEVVKNMMICQHSPPPPQVPNALAAEDIGGCELLNTSSLSSGTCAGGMCPTSTDDQLGDTGAGGYGGAVVHSPQTMSSSGSNNNDAAFMRALERSSSHFQQLATEPRLSPPPPPSLAAASADHQRCGYTCKCDIWSLGVVLFELVTGKPPYTFHTVKHLGTSGKRWQDSIDFTLVAEPEMRDLLRQMLCDDPALRLTAEQCLQHEALAGHYSKLSAGFNPEYRAQLEKHGIKLSAAVENDLDQFAKFDAAEKCVETKLGILALMKKALYNRQESAIASLKDILARYASDLKPIVSSPIVPTY